MKTDLRRAHAVVLETCARPTELKAIARKTRSRSVVAIKGVSRFAITVTLGIWTLHSMDVVHRQFAGASRAARPADRGTTFRHATRKIRTFV